MNGTMSNGWLRDRLRFLVSFGGAVAAVVAAVVLFAWASQASQDEKIARNKEAVAVFKASVEAKLKSIDEKLDEVRDLLKDRK